MSCSLVFRSTTTCEWAEQHTDNDIYIRPGFEVLMHRVVAAGLQEEGEKTQRSYRCQEVTSPSYASCHVHNCSPLTKI